MIIGQEIGMMALGVDHKQRGCDMPNLAKIMREEMCRLARKEVKAAVAKLQQDNKKLKQAVADHKTRIAQLEKENRRLLAQYKKATGTGAMLDSEEVERARITGAMIRTVRARLGVSQADLARLVGVSPPSVYQWEKKKGRLAFRGDTKARVVEVRKLGVREAHERLEELE